MSKPLHTELVRCLTGDTPPRVWSLLVTVFGDLAQAPGDQVSGRALSTLCDAIGIKPAALRVALHRLRKDGWIESHRTGRQSLHQLTRTGRQQSIAATPRIYGRGTPAADVWLTLFDRNGTSDEGSGVWMAANTLLSCDPPASDDALSLRIDPATRLPDWMAEKICGPQTLAQALTFADRLDRCAEHLAARPDIAPLEVAVLRVLVVHGWRRIVLKVPDLPDQVFPAGWPGDRCRQRVRQLLTDHPRIDLADITMTGGRQIYT